MQIIGEMLSFKRLQTSDILWSDLTSFLNSFLVMIAQPGLRSCGKTFHKIRTEFLPDRTTSELVTYYYIWKKTSIANNSRPHKKGARRNILARKTRTAKPKVAETSEFLDLSSASEHEDTEEGNNSTDFSLYACRHCYTTKSPNWHHGGEFARNHGALLYSAPCTK